MYAFKAFNMMQWRLALRISCSLSSPLGAFPAGTYFRIGGVLLMLLCSLPSPAAEPTPQQLEFFETKIRPLFAEYCYTCHSEKAEKLKGGLRLDTPEALLKGGDSGPAIVPGEPDASLLIKAIRYTDPDLQMPPKNKKLPAQEIANLEAWVKMGAPLPAPPSPARHPLTDV